MMHEQIEPLDRQITVQHQVRPIRFAYIVENNDKADVIFDAIFKDSYRRWGGRRTLIVPATQGIVEEQYIKWLEWYDPDVLYNYAELNEATVEALNKVVFPTLFSRHHTCRKEDDQHWAMPEYKISTASSLSMIPLVGRSESGNLPCIMDAYFIDEEDRFFLDNFGEIDCNNRGDLFTTITLKPKESNVKKQFQGELEFRTCGELLEHISQKRSVMCLSQLSGKDTSIYRTSYNHTFSNGLNLIIGNSFEDRLYFWNSRHLVDESNMLDFPAMRIPVDKLSDEPFIKGLVEFLKSWYYMFPGAQGQTHVVVRSYSLKKQVLEDFIARLKAYANWLHIYVDDKRPLPIPQKFDERPYHFQGYPHSDRVNESPFRIIPKEPKHFHYIQPPHTYLKEGSYAVDIAIERYNNHSRTINKPHWWQLPKRQEILRLFLSGHTRVTHQGTLSVIYSRFKDSMLRRDYSQEHVIQLTFPEDKTFFAIIFRNEKSYDKNDLRTEESYPYYSDTATSSKGRGLQAIVHTFGELSPAYEFIDNRFWREAVEDMLAFKKTVNADGVTETQIGEHPKTKTYEEFKQQRNKSFNAFKKAAAQQGQGFHDKGAQQDIIRDFESTLKELVACYVFFQGYSWTCRNCGNQNWVTVHAFDLVSKCEICEHERQIDVKNLAWEFRLNQRIGNALYKESVISELWTLGKLQDEARESFYYIPQSELYRNHEDKECDKEIDIVCIQDGNYIIGESKYSASGFNDGVIEKLIDLAKETKPDSVILSYINEDSDISAQAKKICDAGFKIRILNPTNTRFNDYGPWSYV